ncbi:MAG: hypothetical protein ACPGRH_04800 [Alphaproteobacteria bacterium]
MHRIIFVIFASLLMFSACDLRPTYDPNVVGILAQVSVSPMEDRKGQIARSALQRSLNPNLLNAEKRYELRARVSTSTRVPLDVNSEFQTAVETLTIHGRLLDLDGSELWAGSSSRSSLYAKPQLPTLALDTQEDLWKDLASLAASDITRQLSVFLVEN